MKYTYSDDEDMTFSDSTNRRSARNTGTNTPVDTGPVTTSSGRQIRAPSRLNVTAEDSGPNSVKGDTPDLDAEDSTGPSGRPRRTAATAQGANAWNGSESRSRRNTSAGSDEESEAEFGDDEEDADEHVPEESEDDDEFDEDEAMVEDDLDEPPQSLVVKLSVTPPKLQTALSPTEEKPNTDLRVSTPSREPTANMPTPNVAGRSEEEQGEPAPTTDKATPNGIKITNPMADGAHTGLKVDPSVRPRTPEHPAEPLAEKTANLAAAPATSLVFRGSPDKTQEHKPSLPHEDVDHD